MFSLCVNRVINIQITASIEKSNPTSTIAVESKIEHIKQIDARDPILVKNKTII